MPCPSVEIHARISIAYPAGGPAVRFDPRGDDRLSDSLWFAWWTKIGRVGLGYTYTVNTIGAGAVWKMIESDLAPLLAGGQTLSAIEMRFGSGCGGICTFVGRGGMASFAMAAIDIALWDLRGQRESLALWRLLGGSRPEVPAYAGGIDLDLPIESLLSQANGFLGPRVPCHQDESRAGPNYRRTLSGSEQCGNLLGPDFPLMADANMRWGVDQAVQCGQMHCRNLAFIGWKSPLFQKI